MTTAPGSAVLRRAALVAGLLTTALVGHAAAQACPLATPADYVAHPSTLRTIQPESLFVAGDVSACPGGTNTQPCGGHRVYVPDPNSPYRRDDQIFVFLPGSSSEPNKYDDVLSMAAYAGYRTIGLSYDNSNNIESTCGNVCPCFGLARREVIHGTPLTPLVTVQPADAIVHRLYRLAKHLHATFPTEGWDQIVNRDDHDGVPEFSDIDWDLVVLSGHSQGAGHALLMSKLDAMDGLVVFDGGNDACSTGGRTYAQWHDLPNIPHPKRAFSHDRGGVFALPASFIAMAFGLAAGDFEVLDLIWPTSELVATTNQVPPVGCTEHGSMAYDGCMPDGLATGAAAATPADAYLFPNYVEWMCEVGN
jgi:hypothetical protein